MVEIDFKAKKVKYLSCFSLVKAAGDYGQKSNSFYSAIIISNYCYCNS